MSEEIIYNKNAYDFSPFPEMKPIVFCTESFLENAGVSSVETLNYSIKKVVAIIETDKGEIKVVVKEEGENNE